MTDNIEDFKIPFNDFFNRFFRDELGSLPKKPGGGVWFTETMDYLTVYKKWDDRAWKIDEKNEKKDVYTRIKDANFIIDTTVFKNFGEGIYVRIGSKCHITIKQAFEDWVIIEDVKNIYYFDASEELKIHGHYIKLISKEAQTYGKRLAECFDAYLNQNKESDKSLTEDEKLASSVLENVDKRLSEIYQKLDKLTELESL